MIEFCQNHTHGFPDPACITCERDKLREERNALRMSLDAAYGPHCTSCGSAIDPDNCWCGTPIVEGKFHAEDHPATPMGCMCGFATQDWKQLAKSRGELLWKMRRELAQAQVVVEAAVAWRDTWRHRHPFGEEAKAVALVDAVDAAIAAKAKQQVLADG